MTGVTGTISGTVFTSYADFGALSSDANCPIDSYELVDASDTPYTGSDFSLDPSSAGLYFYFDGGATTLISKIIKIRIIDSNSKYRLTSQIEVGTQCDPSTPVITEGSYPGPGGLSSPQEF